MIHSSKQEDRVMVKDLKKIAAEYKAKRLASRPEGPAEALERVDEVKRIVDAIFKLFGSTDPTTEEDSDDAVQAQLCTAALMVALQEHIVSNYFARGAVAEWIGERITNLKDLTQYGGRY
jgi:hypothetical protein